MFIHMSIHVPNPGFEQEVIDSMKRVRLAALGTPGLMHIGPWRDGDGGLAAGDPVALHEVYGVLARGEQRFSVAAA